MSMTALVPTAVKLCKVHLECALTSKLTKPSTVLRETADIRDRHVWCQWVCLVGMSVDVSSGCQWVCLVGVSSGCVCVHVNILYVLFLGGTHPLI